MGKYKARATPNRHVRCGAPVLFVSGLVILGISAFAAQGEDTGVFVVGSSHIGEIVEVLSGDAAVNVQTLVPPTMCPGHFDVKPSVITALRGSRCVLIHDWQAKMPGVESVLAAAGVGADRVHAVSVEGNWLVPEVQEQAVQRVAAVLSSLNPASGKEYEKRAAERIEAVRKAGAEVLTQLRECGCGGVSVVCHDKLSGFLKWAGFGVVGEYGQDGQLSAGRMAELVRDCGAAQVKLVVDNAQGGGLRTGAAIARDTGAAHVILSNFPGGFSGVETWDGTLRKNAEILARAVRGVPPNAR